MSLELNKIGEHLLAGVMFHSDAADLFCLLGLEGFAKWQRDQSLKEYHCLNNLKKYTMKYHRMLLDVRNAKQDESLIAESWYDKSSLDVTQNDVITIMPKFIAKYLEREENVLNSLNEEKEKMTKLSDKMFAKEVIKEVEEEIANIYEIKRKLEITKYNFDHVCEISNEYCK